GGMFGPGRVLMPARGFLTLADARPGRRYRIKKVTGGCRMNARLCAMGLMPGEILNVYSASIGGPSCITVKGTKFAVGRGMADRIIIEEL
ncbi:MAG: FeoA domain-containing protein, partial [Actinobacteria bacterium]|nr:FeoA domain-containing protein [Actinomycetota bacterium]